jgi:hypothetical protein
MATTPTAHSKVMSGARAKLAITRGNTTQWVGIFNSVSWGMAYDVAPAYVLGRFSAASLEYTGQSTVGVSCSGWRVVGSGPHVAASMPKLGDLLTENAGYMVIVIVDRQTGETIARIKDVKAESYSTSLASRDLEQVTVNFVGKRVDDESTENDEAPSAMDLEITSR